MTQKTASPDLVKVSDLAKELQMDELILRLALDESKVPNADEVTTITQEQAEAVRNGHNLYMKGADLPAPETPKPNTGSAIATQSNSQLNQTSQEAQQLSAGVITILQELGVKQKLVEGHHQGSVEVAAYQAGRGAVWEAFAHQEIQQAQQAMGNSQAFDVAKTLKDLGVTLPGDRLPGLNKTTTEALNNLRKSAEQCTQNPWK